jgi:pimeloyl-ACP methyl ester carboxylesterase
MTQDTQRSEPAVAKANGLELVYDAFGDRTAAPLGGAIAQLVAMHHRPRVRTLTSIMATSGDPELPPPTPEAMAVLLTPTPTEREAYIERYIKTWKVLRGAGFPLDEERDAQRAGQLHARGLNPPGVARQLAAIIASGSRRQQLQSLRVPTLIIHGEADPLVPVACGIDVARSVPDAKLVVIEGMGHALPVTMWPRIVDAIAEHAV